MGQNHEEDRVMEASMEEKTIIREELAEFLETYYNGSFPQMACGYIRSMGITQEEVEELLEAMRLCIS